MVTDSLLKRRIILTLSYSAQFNYPLTLQELWYRLILMEPASFTQFQNNIEDLIKLNILTKDGDYYCLHTYPLDSKIRRSREEYSKSKLDESMKFIDLASKIPWIQAIAITGSVAVHNAKADDDVDFLIITDSHRLWLTRLLVIGIALYNKKRRSWGREEKNSWCFNLWLEVDSLRLPKRLQTVYGAYELFQAQWVFVRNASVSSLYYKKNSWARKKLINYPIINTVPRKSGTSFMKSVVKNSFLFTLINKTTYVLQRMYMIPHITNEQVTQKTAFFHPRDTKADIYGKWKAILRTI